MAAYPLFPPNILGVCILNLHRNLQYNIIKLPVGLVWGHPHMLHYVCDGQRSRAGYAPQAMHQHTAVSLTHFVWFGGRKQLNNKCFWSECDGSIWNIQWNPATMPLAAKLISWLCRYSERRVLSFFWVKITSLQCQPISLWRQFLPVTKIGVVSGFHWKFLFSN